MVKLNWPVQNRELSLDAKSTKTSHENTLVPVPMYYQPILAFLRQPTIMVKTLPSIIYYYFDHACKTAIDDALGMFYFGNLPQI